MPTAEDLAQLKTLLNQLLPIAQVQAGELIRADSWNGLVNATMTLARTLLDRASDATVSAHTHLDQVTADWLAPTLRDQLQRGPLADPAMQSRLLAIEQQLKALLKQVDGQREDLSGVRGRLTDIATRDIVRESAVSDVTRKFAGLGDSRTDILDLRKSLGVVQNDMGTVLDAAQKLQVNGQTVDVGSLVARVGTLETFKSGFTAANGQVLDASAIEQRLAENRNQFVLHAQLDDALTNRPVEFTPAVLAGIEDRVGTTLRAQVNASFDTFGTQLRGETRASLSNVGDLVTSRLNDALPGVTQTVTASLTTVVDRAKQDAVAAAVKQAADQTGARETVIRADFDRLGADLRASFQTTVSAQLAQALPSALSDIRSSITALNSKTDVLGTRTGTIETTIGRQGGDIALLQQDSGRQRLELRDLLQSEIRLAADNISRDLTTNLQTMQATFRTQFDGLSSTITRSAIDSARAAAVDAAQVESRNARTQLLAEMRQVAKEEAGVLVREQVRAVTTTGGGGVVINRSDIILNR